MFLKILAVLICVLSIIWILVRNFKHKIYSETRELVIALIPFVIRVPTQSFLVLVFKILNREDLVIRFYEEKLNHICMTMLKSATFFKKDDNKFNKVLLESVFKVCTLEIFPFYGMRGRILEKATSNAIRKVEWHLKVNAQEF